MSLKTQSQLISPLAPELNVQRDVQETEISITAA
jgi:hypothetical protein